ncbi:MULTISPECIES: hypothetical protein [unclassified Acinetobacter]|uniref:hypothetical protein n=1 Tax=unclassified Acinetobacter TaxID=196816 RepID=UPI0035B853CA
MGVKLGEQKNLQIYGGLVGQRLNGDVHLRGIAYQGANGYDARIKENDALGWLAGLSYSKPEIALRASLTYRSKIDHDTTITENFPALGLKTVQDFKATTPDSYNFDFQTGVSPTMLATAKVRYVPWSKFTVNPPSYGKATQMSIGKALPLL